MVLICSGTANDLAHEVGINEKIEKAARAVLDGEIKKIDIIEVIAGSKKAYMVTNGGLGIPALTADLSNQFRSHAIGSSSGRISPIGMGLEEFAKELCPSWSANLFGDADRGHAGVAIPKLVLANRHGQANDSETQLPFVLINNQPGIGQSFTPAPYTSNSDGTFNGLIVEADSFLKQLDAVWQVKQGRIDRLKECVSFETAKMAIRSLTERKFTFFGDGEILHRNVSEVEIRCLYQIIPLLLTNS